MNIKNSWKLEICLLVVDLMVIFLIAAWVVGLRVNITTSLPKGIYRLSSEDIERGDLVAFCLPPDNPFSSLAGERGYLGPGRCSNGLRPLLKHLVGLPGDDLQIGNDELILNGVRLVGSKRPKLDRHGRDLPPSLLNDGLIPDGHVLVLAQEHVGSFDSRHFGLISFSSLYKVKPILIFGDAPHQPQGD